MASIEELKSNIKSGFAKADRFEVQLPPLNTIPRISTSAIIDYITGQQNINFDVGGVLDQLGNLVPEAATGFIDAALQRAGIERVNFPEIGLLNLPGGVRVDLNESRRVSMFCTSVNMPGRQMTTASRTIGMVTQQMPYGFVNDEVQMVFRLDNDYTPYRYFWEWQTRILNPKNFEMGYKKEYARDVTISQLNESDNRTAYKVKLRDAFPRTVSAIQLADGNANTITELTIDFSYTYFEPQSPQVPDLQTIREGSREFQNTRQRLINQTQNFI